MSDELMKLTLSSYSEQNVEHSEDIMSVYAHVFHVQQLTAFNRMRGGLERDVLSTRLRYVHAEHKANAGVFPADVRLSLPQLDVGVPELQDPGAVDSVSGGRGGGGNDDLNKELLVPSC